MGCDWWVNPESVDQEWDVDGDDEERFEVLLLLRYLQIWGAPRTNLHHIRPKSQLYGGKSTFDERSVVRCLDVDEHDAARCAVLLFVLNATANCCRILFSSLPPFLSLPLSRRHFSRERNNRLRASETEVDGIHLTSASLIGTSPPVECPALRARNMPNAPLSLPQSGLLK